MTQARIKLDKLDTKTLAHLYKIKTSHFEYYELPWNQNIRHEYIHVFHEINYSLN